MEKFVSGRIARGLAFAVVAAALAGGAVAQDRWPSRPLRLISTSVAGGNIDVMCRIIAEKLSLRLGQPVVVDNRPGAATVLGTAEAAKAPPDGYTDRKSTRLNSSHLVISYAVFCLKRKKRRPRMLRLIGRLDWASRSLLPTRTSTTLRCKFPPALFARVSHKRQLAVQCLCPLLPSA